MLDHTLPVAQRRRRVAAYLYTYTRIMELECSWTMTVPNTTFKVALGRKIGYDGIAIERLTRRVTQMYSTGSRGAAPRELARWLDDHHALSDESDIAALIIAVNDELRRSIETYLKDAHHGDEPTKLLLQSLLGELALGREVMAPYARTQMTAPSIDAPDEVVEYTGTEPLVAIPNFPARPADSYVDPSLANPVQLPPEELFTDANMIRVFRRMYIEIEISAIEVCSRNIIEYRDMPNAFKVDMSAQIWDEARHAEIAVDLIQHFGGQLGALGYSGLVWTRHQMGSSLAERLAIEQGIQEGNSCDRAYNQILNLRKFGQPEAAEAIEWITADETQHALYGNRWLLRLCDNDREKYEAVMAAAQEKIKFPLGAVNRELRSVSGFPSWYVEKLESQVAAAKPPSR